MTKSQLIEALQKIEGDPEVRIHQNLRMSLPIVFVQDMPEGDFNGGGITYEGRWRCNERYIQIQHGRDQEIMIFM